MGNGHDFNESWNMHPEEKAKWDAWQKQLLKNQSAEKRFELAEAIVTSAKKTFENAMKEFHRMEITPKTLWAVQSELNRILRDLSVDDLLTVDVTQGLDRKTLQVQFKRIYTGEN